MNAWSNTEPVRYLVLRLGALLHARPNFEAVLELADPGDTVVVEMCRVVSGFRRPRYEPAMTLWL
jgi:hypothetical protein